MGVQSTRLILHFSSSFSTTTSIEMEGSRDTSNATSGDGVSKHYGFQTRPTVNLSNRDDKKYGDYDTSADTGANKAKAGKGAGGKDAAGKDAAGKDQPEKSAK